MKFELDYIEKLVELVNKNELSELVLEDSDKAIIIKKEKEILTQGINPSTVLLQSAINEKNNENIETQQKENTKTEERTQESKPKGKPITSPMVGTFYKAPSPQSAPFVTVGDLVSVGQVVCIIEAMKLMNEIESEVSGRITKICVEDGQSVEYGQVLMYVE